MATSAAAERNDARSKKGGAWASLVDQWMFVLMAVWLILVVLAGFGPDSVRRLALIEGGGRPPFTWQAHFHALTVGSWMILLLAQTVLMARGARRGHMQLGLLGAFLAPTMVLAGVLLVPANLRSWIAFAAEGGPEVQAGLDTVIQNALNIALIQIRVACCFLLFVAWGLLARRTDPSTHKRMMVLATIIPLGAATSRIAWLPNTLPASPLSALLWPLATVIPMLVWDIYRMRRVHKAYLVFLGVYVASALPVLALWNSAQWLDLIGLLLIP